MYKIRKTGISCIRLLMLGGTVDKIITNILQRVITQEGWVMTSAVTLSYICDQSHMNEMAESCLVSCDYCVTGDKCLQCLCLGSWSVYLTMVIINMVIYLLHQQVTLK